MSSQKTYIKNNNNNKPFIVHEESFLSSYVFQYEMNYYIKDKKRTYQTTKVLILIRSKINLKNDKKSMKK